jgi:hypothetical protein
MTNRRSDILVALASHDDGSGTLGIIVDQALADDPDVSIQDVREIVIEAEEDARELNAHTITDDQIREAKAINAARARARAQA